VSTGDIRHICQCHNLGHCPCCAKLDMPPYWKLQKDKEQDDALHRIAEHLLDNSRCVSIKEAEAMNSYMKKRYKKA